jgi:hypothetical protein
MTRRVEALATLELILPSGLGALMLAAARGGAPPQAEGSQEAGP